MEQAKGIENLQILLAGTIGMTILFGFIIFFIILYQNKRIAEQEERRLLMEANQERVLSAILDTQENERRRIARDLHDEVGSYLSIAKMKLGHLPKYIKAGEEQEEIDEAYSILDDTLKNVRRISKDLHPVVLEKYGLFEAVNAFGKKITSDNLKVIIKSTDEAGRLPENQELNIFRIVQELLSNALKHSQASEVELRLDLDDQQLLMYYKDNGIGFNINKSDKVGGLGIGMVTIDTRVRMLKGTWNLDSQPGEGTTATFYFPVREKV